MKKLFVLVSCLTIVLFLSNKSFAQSEESPAPDVLPAAETESALMLVGNIVSEDLIPAAKPLPFGYPPYPTTAEGYPAFGAPYSFPRVQRRLGSGLAGRFAPTQRYQPYPLPTPGAVPGPFVMPVPPMSVSPPLVSGEVPAKGILTVKTAPIDPPPGQATIVYRPTPIKNFMTLMAAPRPYIGYNPYVGYPPFPGYIPPK